MIKRALSCQCLYRVLLGRLVSSKPQLYMEPLYRQARWNGQSKTTLEPFGPAEGVNDKDKESL